jgi:hypothetical protein
VSYLTSDNNLDAFTECIIEFWYRVPQETTDKVNASRGSDTDFLRGRIIPLVMMGKEGVQGSSGQQPTQPNGIQVPLYSGNTALRPVQTIDQTTECLHYDEIFPTTCSQFQTTKTFDGSWIEYDVGDSYEYLYPITAGPPGLPSTPSVIGVYPNGSLYINFETTKKPDVKNITWNYTIAPGSVHGSTGGTSYVAGTQVWRNCTGIGILHGYCTLASELISDDRHQVGPFDGVASPPPTYNYVDASALSYNGTGTIQSDGYIAPKLPEGKQWHHVLISLKLNTIAVHGTPTAFDPVSAEDLPNYVDSAAQLYVALDDVNYTKRDLARNWSDGGGPNDVITADAWRIRGTNATINKNDPTNQTFLGQPTYTLARPTIPAGPVGIPATKKYVDDIHRVEMARFRMWTRKHIDPADVDKRRLFINDKGKPAKRSLATDALGKPDIEFRSSGNFSRGKNTGTAGDFTPKAKIKPWKPEPSLYGPQIPKP